MIWDWLPKFELMHPAALLLLPLAWLVWSERVWTGGIRIGGFGVSPTPEGRGSLQGRLPRVVFCRVLVCVLLCLVLAGPRCRLRTSRRFVIFVRDVSARVSDASRSATDQFIAEALLQRRRNGYAVVEFGGEKQKQSQAERWPGDAGGIDPGRAVLRAAAEIPPGWVGEIVLISDGLQTRGDLLRASLGAGLPISVVPLQPYDATEVALTDLKTYAMAHPFHWLPVEVMVESRSENGGVLRLRQNGQLIEQRDVKLQSGENRFAFYVKPVFVQRASNVYAKLQVEILPREDQIPSNNHRAAIVGRLPTPKVMLVRQQAGTGDWLAEILRSNGFSVEVQELESFAATQPKAEVDLVILADVSPARLPQAGTDWLREHVFLRGGGLLAVGGELTFGESLTATSLEEILPLATAGAPPPRQSLAMILIIDRSQSMLEQDRLQLAKQAARQSVSLLAPTDLVGVIAFGDDTPWIQELAPCGDAGEVQRRIDSLQASGRTNMFPALVRARVALEQSAAERKHAIVLTDGVASPGDFDQVAREMAQAGITLSAVSISSGAERQILIDMARIAGGRHYHCDDPNDIPAVLVQETLSAVDSPAGPLTPILSQPLPWLSLQGAPAWSGYVATIAKPQAQVILTTPGGDPLLAWWRFGQGVATAVTTKAENGLARDWRDWTGSDAFWTRVCALTIRQHRPSEFAWDLHREGEKATLRIDAAARDHWINDAEANVKMGQELHLDLRAPGRYEVDFSAPSSDLVATARISLGQQRTVEQTLGMAGEDDDHYRLATAHDELLRRVCSATNGRYAPAAEQVFQGERSPAETQILLWPFLIVAGAFLVVVEIALRRSWRRK